MIAMAKDTKEGLGLNTEQIANLAREAFLQVLGASDGQQAGPQWHPLAELLEDVCSRELHVTWLALAKRAAQEYHGEDAWEEMPQQIQLGWEAAVRAGVNAVQALDAMDAEEIDAFDWMAWAAERLGVQQEVSIGKEATPDDE
jgi:hypothetical protein